MRRSINLGGRPVSYELERKRVKNINLRVKPGGQIFVSAPSRVPVGAIEEFMQRKAAAILAAVARMEQAGAARPGTAPAACRDGAEIPVFGVCRTLRVVCGKRGESRLEGDELILAVRDREDEALIGRELEAFLKGELERVLSELCEKVYPRFKPYGVSMPRIRTRRMTSRWGSCIPAKGTVTFSTLLAAMPVSSIEFVVVHEFTHFLHPDHSPAFYSRLASFMPDWKKRKSELKAAAGILR